ncbi:unnamed protein product, partial [Medioppia subpectinata]
MARANKWLGCRPIGLISSHVNHIDIACNKMLITLLWIILWTSSGICDKQRCEEISIPMCRGIGYNYTVMPNQFHHDTQEEAGLEVHQFWPLVEIQCSDDLRFFLCSMYAPICMDDYSGRLPACRSVCERAKHGCAPIMRHYGFAWPERMDCNDLPLYGDKQLLCMDSKEGATLTDNRQHILASKPIVTSNKEDSIAMNGNAVKDKTVRPNNRRPMSKGRQEISRPGTSGSVTHLNGVLTSDECKCECRHPLILAQDLMDRRFNNRVETAGMGGMGGVANCLMPCKGVFFSKAEKEMAVFWIGIFAVVCCVCTSITVLTFVIDMERFRYPERSIIFLSGCYLMVSIGYIIRSYIGHDPIACDGLLIRYQRTGPAPVVCVLVFLLIYFFGMASSVWWVILTITWFLSAGLKWSNEGIAGSSTSLGTPDNLSDRLSLPTVLDRLTITSNSDTNLTSINYELQELIESRELMARANKWLGCRPIGLISSHVNHIDMKCNKMLITLLWIILWTSSGICDKQRCEEISIPMCRGIGYNYTVMPNQFHHDTQEEAGLEVHQFWPLVEIQCSDDLRFFLCSMYAPICMDDYSGRLPACRSVCERAKHGCAPIMRHYGFAWPERMDCNDLPLYGDKQLLCMDSKEGATLTDNRQHILASKPIVTSNKEDSIAMNGNSVKDKTVRPNNRRPMSKGRQEISRPGTSGSVTHLNGVVTSDECKCECRHPLILAQDLMDRRFNNRVETAGMGGMGGVANCLMPCKGVFFSKAEKEMAVFWIGIFAV